MIPSLVLVRSNKKRHVAVTQKKNIRIGTHKDSDVIVNHPHLYKHPQLLGPGSAPEKSIPGDPLPGEPNPKETTKNQARTSFFLPVYTFSIDGLNVRLVHLKVLFSTLLIVCIGIAYLTSHLKDHRAFSIDQNWTPITLPAKDVYGFCRQDQSHREGARFSFEAKQFQPHRLIFFAGGKGDGTAIKLAVNGTVIKKPLNLPSGWGEERSVPIPPAHIRDGENIIEVIPVNTKTSPASWGISNVRAQIIDQSNNHLGDAATPEPALILEALKKENMGGQELAHYYEIVSSLDTAPLSDGSSFDRDSIKEEIEQRMSIKLRLVAFDVRSKNILGDESAVQQLLDDTRSWIPGDWPEGWEIYNELCR